MLLSLTSHPVLVTGADGFIGRWVARALSGAGARVTACVVDARAAADVLERWSVEADVLEADLVAPGVAESVLAETRPSVVFNLAGYGVGRDERDPERARAVNVELVDSLARATARQTGIGWGGTRFVHVGSALEYGTVGGDLAEDGLHHPTTLYGKTKLAGTEALAKAARETALPALTARLFMVYGPGERPGRLFPTLFDGARSGEEVPLSEGLQRRDFTYVEDVAEGLVRLACVPAGTSEPGDVCNLATGRLTSIREFATIAARVLGIPDERLRFGEVAVRAEEMEHAEVSVKRLEEWTGWRPAHDPESGLRAATTFLSESRAPS